MGFVVTPAGQPATEMRGVRPNSVVVRLGELRRLKDGWLDGKGRAPSQEGLAWFAQRFESHYPEELPLPYLYPTAEGGVVQAEWTLGDHEATLEVSFETRRGEWHYLNLATEEEVSQVLPLDGEEGWQWLAVQLRLMVGMRG